MVYGQLTKSSLKLTVQNPNNPGEAFYYEISEFYSSIEPTKTTSIRKKDLLTILIHKKEHANWPSLTSQITEANADEEETARDKSDSPVKEAPKAPRSVRESKEEIPKPKIQPTALHRSPGRTKLDEERSPTGSAGKEKISNEASLSKQSYGTRGGKKTDSGLLNDPYFEEISKDFKDLRNSKEDPLRFPQASPKVVLCLT